MIDKSQSVVDGVGVTTGPSTSTKPRSLVHHHDFRQLWAGDAVSQFGWQLVGLAMPIMAVRVLEAGEFEMGLLGETVGPPTVLGRQTPQPRKGPPSCRRTCAPSFDGFP